MEHAKHASNRRIADGLLALSLVIILLAAGWVFYEWRTDGTFNGILLMISLLPAVLAFLARSTIASANE